MAYRVSASLLPSATRELLRQARASLKPSETTKLVVDSGMENFHSAVDDELKVSPVTRLEAQVDIVSSNSMIEAFWKSMKHNWLFLNRLDSVEAVKRHVDFYVEQHNSVMSPSVFPWRPRTTSSNSR